MKETGIIMSGNHPKLILDELKTLTRRTWGLEVINKNPDDWCNPKPIPQERLLHSHYKSIWEFDKKSGGWLIVKCPYGGVGDRLWVRETWAVNPTMDNTPLSRISSVAFVYYKATAKGSPLLIGKWRPSIFMPHWASRILLEIIEVRVQRIQEISIEDSIAEGCDKVIYGGDVRQDFISLWDSINAKRGYGWDKNPWVWCISFRRII